MISQIKLKNFRCFEDSFIDFKDKRGSVRPLNFVFGDNASGKTSFVMAFGFLKHSCESLIIDHLLEQREETQFSHSISPFILKEHISRHYRKGSHAPMVLEFDFLEGSTVYRYKMVMIQGTIIEESLYRRKKSDFILCFHAKNSVVDWGTRILLTREADKFEYLIQQYRSNYSILSILCFIHSSLSPHTLRIHPAIVEFISVIDALYVDIDRYYHHPTQMAYIKDHDLGPFAGYINDQSLMEIKNSLPIFNGILQILYPNLAEVNYRVTKIKNDLNKYQIEIHFKSDLGTYIVPNDDVPKSLYDFLVMMSNVIGSKKFFTYIIDNFAYNTSSFALEQLFSTVFPIINVRGIFMMTDNDAMNLTNPSDIYITWSKDFKYQVSRLSDLFSVQQNHNLRSRFEKGLIVPTHRTQHNDLNVNVTKYVQELKRNR